MVDLVCSATDMHLVTVGPACAAEMLRSALFMTLGPLLAALLYFALNSPWVAAKLR